MNEYLDSARPAGVNVSPSVDPGAAPPWLAPLVRACVRLDPVTVGSDRRPPASDVAYRRAAVLVLFSDGQHEDEPSPDVVLIERASGLREHAGQVAFPGGTTDPDDAGPVATALREAAEETGLDPAGTQPVAVLPELYVPPSGFVVTPVLAYWRSPVPVAPGDPAETASVLRVPVAALADPASRFQVRHPSGHVGPAFEVGCLVVWGFTGALLSALLDLGGWSRTWDDDIVYDLSAAWTTARSRARVGRREVAR